jgi:hypothetical protein
LTPSLHRGVYTLHHQRELVGEGFAVRGRRGAHVGGELADPGADPVLELDGAHADAFR